MGTLIDIIKDFAFGSISSELQSSLTDYSKECKLKDKLTEYLEQEKKKHETASLDDELDFEGLRKYILEHFLDNILQHITDSATLPDKAASQMEAQIYNAAHATTTASKERVNRILESCISIVKDTLFGSLTTEQKIQNADLKAELSGRTNEILLEVKKQQNPIQNTLDLISEGKITEAEASLTNQLASLQRRHELFPFYLIENKSDAQGNIHFFSKPTSKEAIIKYPPTIQLQIQPDLSSINTAEIKTNLADYSYKNQVPIHGKVVGAVKFLGDQEDQFQYEAQKLLNAEWIATPPKLSPQIPCQVFIEDKIEIEYTLFRLDKIIADEQYIISNEEDTDCPYIIRMKYNITTTFLTVNIEIRNYSNLNYLHYLKLMQKLSNGASIIIHPLQKHKDIIIAAFDEYKFPPVFGSFDNTINFFQRIIEIETYLNHPIILPSQLSIDDYNKVNTISNLLKGIPVDFTWSGEFTLPISSIDNLKEFISKYDGEPFPIRFVGLQDFNLFGEIFTLNVLIEYNNAVFKNYKKLKKIVSILDNGDPLSVIIAAAQSESTGFEMLYQGQDQE